MFNPFKKHTVVEVVNSDIEKALKLTDQEMYNVMFRLENNEDFKIYKAILNQNIHQTMNELLKDKPDRDDRHLKGMVNGLSFAEAHPRSFIKRYENLNKQRNTEDAIDISG